MPAPVRRPLTHREGRLLRRAAPLVLLAVVAFVVGVISGSDGSGADRDTARRYAAAWARKDWAAMYNLLDASSRARVTPAQFAADNEAAAATATIDRAEVGDAEGADGDLVRVPVTAETHAFGRLRLAWEIPVRERRIHYSDSLVFPGLRAGEKLTRTVALPPRAAILARDGTPLARGPDRSSPVSDVAGQIVGEMGSPPASERLTRRAEGYPPTALVGTTGLERALESRLSGRPGGTLKAGPRVLATTKPVRANAVRTSIDVGIERAAITALAGRLGGASAIDPRTGEVLALAGVAYSALQPPGSTFKIITAEAALEAKQVKLTDQFPVETGAVLEGRTLENASGESCGGTFLQSFAKSCNSVFAPLGAKVGAEKLVAAAEKFGFNTPIGIPGAATSTIPAASEIGDDLSVGSSAIGQGRVQATSLQMAVVAGTVAAHGKRPVLTLLAHPKPNLVDAFPRPIARTLRHLMLAVVTEGTGTSAQIPGVEVAGKTGTAELQDTTQPTESGQAPIDTDAWFVAFAPARKARIAVGVLLVQAGGGGAVAAPAARTIVEAGLKKRR